jgi:urease accessory protein
MNAGGALLAKQDVEGWRAELVLQFEAREDRTILASRRHVGPLVIQRPFYPEGGPCHVYIVHPPGGIVAGDRLAIDVTCGPQAHALLTTPAATKFYRSEAREAVQQQSVSAASATIEWLPQETIFYPAARARAVTTVRLSRDSRFIGWEIPCLGLPARNQPFSTGALKLDFELWIDDAPRLVDRLRLDGANPARTARWGLGGHDAMGTMLAYPANRAMLDAARSAADEASETVVATTLVDEVLVCRCLGAQAEHVKQALVRIWRRLRPLLLDRPAVAPRIWET